MINQPLPPDLGVVKKTSVQAYHPDRKILSVLMEGGDFGIEVIFELHQGEPREWTHVYLLEILSVTTADTREPVQLTPKYKREVIEVVSDWVEENQSIPGDYREF